jgi:hypothetical protein
MLERIFGSKKWQEVGGNCIIRLSIIHTLHLMLGSSRQGG